MTADNLLRLLAMMSPPGQTGRGGSGLMIGYMVIIFAIFYLLMIRPQQKKEKERKALIASTKTGDRVIFGGGLIGTVANVKEHTFVIRIADGVKVEVLRGAVTRTLQKDEKITAEEEKK